MRRTDQDPTLDEYGDETHPAFATIQASRISHGGTEGGAVLFDSDIRHGHTVRVTVTGATRKRDLSTDWIRGKSKPLIEVEMSEAQWASFVSSMNTTGVPCTLRAKETDWDIPGLPYDPRLAHSMDEAKGAADKAFEEARAALAAYEVALSNGGAKDKREALGRLKRAIGHAGSNVDFANKRLAEHAENVVQKARGDIEAMVTNKAVQLGLTSAEAAGLVALPTMPSGRAIER